MSLFSSYNYNNKPLDAGSTYLGSGENIELWANVHVVLKTDKLAKLTLEWSLNNVDFDFTEVYHHVKANTPFEIRSHHKAKFFRIRLENIDGANQTFCRLGVRYVNNMDSLQTHTLTYWDGETVGIGQATPTMNLERFTRVQVFGHADGATDLYTDVSNDDGTSWYETDNVMSIGGAGDFCFDFTVPADIYRIRSSAGCTITLAVSGHN